MNDAELRSLRRLCSKDDLSDSNVASLTVLGLAAVDEIEILRGRLPTSDDDRGTVAFIREMLAEQEHRAITDEHRQSCGRALALLDRLSGVPL